MNFKKFGWLLLVALTLVLTACGKSQSQNGKLKVMTTFYPVYDFTKNNYEEIRKYISDHLLIFGIFENSEDLDEK